MAEHIHTEAEREARIAATIAALKKVKIEPMLPRQSPSIGAIIVAVAHFYEVAVIDIVSHRRTSEIVRPRQVVYFLARTLTLRSLPEIGRRLGNRDHTSVLAGFRKIKALRETDPDLAAQLAELERLLSPDGGA